MIYNLLPKTVSIYVIANMCKTDTSVPSVAYRNLRRYTISNLVGTEILYSMYFY